MSIHGAMKAELYEELTADLRVYVREQVRAELKKQAEQASNAKAAAPSKKAEPAKEADVEF